MDELPDELAAVLYRLLRKVMDMQMELGSSSEQRWITTEVAQIILSASPQVHRAVAKAEREADIAEKL